MIADDRRTFCDLRSAIRDRLRSYGNQPWYRFYSLVFNSIPPTRCNNLYLWRKSFSTFLINNSNREGQLIIIWSRTFSLSFTERFSFAAFTHVDYWWNLTGFGRQLTKFTTTRSWMTLHFLLRLYLEKDSKYAWSFMYSKWHYKKQEHWIMQFKTFYWLSHYNVWANIP